MKIVIKNKSELPIYEQIEQQIKNQLLDGTIGEDEQLPSIRQLARDLKISVITTMKAYEELSSHRGTMTCCMSECSAKWRKDLKKQSATAEMRDFPMMR